MPHAVQIQHGIKRPASEEPHQMETPAKKQTKWSEDENELMIELRGNGMKWEDVSRHLPGRSAISCRLHYQNFLEKRAEWDEEKKNRLARLYERFRKEMWERIAKELKTPWRAAEEMHWQLGKMQLAQRAGATPFLAASDGSTSTPPAAVASAPGVPITTSFVPINNYTPQSGYTSSPQAIAPPQLAPRVEGSSILNTPGSAYSAAPLQPPPAYGQYFPPPTQGQGSFTFRKEPPRSTSYESGQQQSQSRPNQLLPYLSPSLQASRPPLHRPASSIESSRSSPARLRAQTGSERVSPPNRGSSSLRNFSSGPSTRASMPPLPQTLPTTRSNTLSPHFPTVPPLLSLPQDPYTLSREGEKSQRLPPMRLAAGEEQQETGSERGPGMRQWAPTETQLQDGGEVSMRPSQGDTKGGDEARRTSNGR